MESGDQPDYGYVKSLLKFAVEERNFQFDGIISEEHARLQKRRVQTRRAGEKRRRLAGNQSVQMRRRLAANNNLVQRRRLLAAANRRQSRETPRQESAQEVALSTPPQSSLLARLWSWIRSRI
ncbi:uncharacterized protein LOC120354792 [Nilaparvata lugens]|uniref:uncharacterized protein LOC120354792 n=1 Tax=Nilaparvata lugens TaxID=108931 RepID=UPI00193D17E5|nr:uncharacterized protein LOC120354792 [Nilaparvata lugens]